MSEIDTAEVRRAAKEWTRNAGNGISVTTVTQLCDALDASNKRLEKLTEGLRELARVAESNSLRETPDEQVAADFRLALEQVKYNGYNDNCLFCEFKDRVVMDALAKHPKEGHHKLLTGPVEIEQGDTE